MLQALHTEHPSAGPGMMTAFDVVLPPGPVVVGPA